MKTNEPHAPLLHAKRAIAVLGGPVKAARVLGVPGGRHQTIQSWLRTRVPAEYCPTIERTTERAVVCEQLRPDVEWAVLRCHVSAAVESCGSLMPEVVAAADGAGHGVNIAGSETISNPNSAAAIV